MSDYLMVAAIDFGTTYSGYAFSTISNFKLDPLEIHVNQAWTAGGGQLLSLKTPTCLLLDGLKQIVSFGYEAENDYAELVMDDEHHDHYYFSRFKMRPYNDKGLTGDMKLEDVTGKSLLAIEVFGLSIQALKSHMQKLLDKEETNFKPHEIKWVLTVPAIWPDSAKQFMGQSAEKAGIYHDQLRIVLEPDAASIYCKYLPTEKFQGASEGFTMGGTGQKYMVIDLGGGTADVTVHETIPNGDLKELCHASGGDCGGTSIDNAFIQMIDKILGATMISLLKQEDPTAYLDLLREFETVKRKINIDTKGKMNLRIPIDTINSLCESHQSETLSSMIQSSPFACTIALRGDKMRIDADVIKSLFGETINNIVSLVEDVLRKPAVKDISILLLVGGFAECPLVQSAMKKTFHNKRILIPENAGLSVLKGAVLFGHKPDYIANRVVRFSYGTNISQLFDPKKHEQHRKYTVNGEDRCRGVFDELIKRNESVEPGTKVNRRYCTIGPNQATIYINMYASENEKPMYVDEDYCFFIGRAEIEIPFPTEEKRWVSVDYYFGDTELRMTAIEELHGTKCEAT